jgi:c-di-GMP-binding flagellar brake protein YcgR
MNEREDEETQMSDEATSNPPEGTSPPQELAPQEELKVEAAVAEEVDPVLIPPPDADKAQEELDASRVWESSAPGPGSGYQSRFPSISERRTAARKGIRLNKLISTELDSNGETRSLYLHLVDISDGGLRVNGDVEFPLEGPFDLKVATEAFGPEVSSLYSEIRLKCVVAWQKRLLGGMFVSGLRFTDLSDEARDAIRSILKICSPDGRRLRFRLNRVLGVGIGLDDETRWLYPLALDLSVEGMRVRIDEQLQTGQKFPLQIFLEFDLPTVQMQAEVVWREEIGPSRYQIGLRFSELNEDNAKTIQDYIDRCLAQETPA